MSYLSESFLSEIPKKASKSFLSEAFLPKVFHPKVTVCILTVCYCFSLFFFRTEDNLRKDPQGDSRSFKVFANNKVSGHHNVSRFCYEFDCANLAV